VRIALAKDNCIPTTEINSKKLIRSL